MTTKHTPGPWTKISGPDAISIMTENQHTKLITRIQHFEWTDEYRAEQQANANLITAAPELLEALKGMADGFLSHVKFVTDGGDVDKFHEYLRAARLAIAKAEGRE